MPFIKNIEEMQKYLNKKKEERKIVHLGKLFCTENKGYFYDTGTGKVLELDDSAYQILEKFFYDKEFFIKDDLDSLKELLEIAVQETLFQAIYPEKFYHDDFCEQVKECLDNDLEQMILEVTGKCNLRCDYCTYNEQYGEQRDFNDQDMSFETAKRAIDYFAEHTSDKAILGFYGGEPLLRYDLIKKCIEYSKEKFKGRQISYSFTTNCVLLTKEMAEYFAGVEELSIVCSIDGPKEVHNEHRKDIGGIGSFDRSIRGFKLLVETFGKENANKISVNGVFTPPLTQEKLQKVYDYFNQLDWLYPEIGIRIDMVRRGTLKNSEQEKQRKNAKLEVNPIWQWGKKRYEEKNVGMDVDRRKSIFMEHIEDGLLHIHTRYINQYPFDNYPFNGCCVPGGRRLYVSTQGKFYLCERIENSPSIGDINSGIDFEAVRKKYIEEYAEQSIQRCRECWAIRLCKVCYASCYNENGVSMDEKDRECRGVKYSLKEYLSSYHQILEENPELLDHLNDIEVS